ncbi:UNVERIFIED_CONTAM: hypothetical protein K2H54_059877 [Gekko kuhli]
MTEAKQTMVEKERGDGRLGMGGVKKLHEMNERSIYRNLSVKQSQEFKSQYRINSSKPGQEVDFGTQRCLVKFSIGGSRTNEEIAKSSEPEGGAEKGPWTLSDQLNMEQTAGWTIPRSAHGCGKRGGLQCCAFWVALAGEGGGNPAASPRSRSP